MPNQSAGAAQVARGQTTVEMAPPLRALLNEGQMQLRVRFAAMAAAAASASRNRQRDAGDSQGRREGGFAAPWRVNQAPSRSIST